MMICDRFWAVIGRRVAWWLRSSLLQRRTSAATYPSSLRSKSIMNSFLKRIRIYNGSPIEECHYVYHCGWDNAFLEYLTRQHGDHSVSLPLRSQCSIPAEERTTLPWYRRLFQRTQREPSQSELEEDQPYNPTILEVRNLHKTYLLGLGSFPHHDVM